MTSETLRMMMMNTAKYLTACAFALTTLMSVPSYAQSTDSQYRSDLKKYQQVCKGKRTGDEVSFAYKTVIWNGTCEPLFTINDQNLNFAKTESNAYQHCMVNPNVKSITLNGKSLKGQCVLTYTPPMPKDLN